MKGKLWSLAKSVRIGLLAIGLVLTITGIVRGIRAGRVDRVTAAEVAQSERISKPLNAEKAIDEPLTPAPKLGMVAGNGIIEPSGREVNVAAVSSGIIETIAVEEGQRVVAGAMIVALQSAPEAATKEAAEAELRLAQAEQARLLAGNRAEDIAAATAEAKAAKARAALSASVLQRTQALHQAKAASFDELERAQRQAASDAETGQAAEERRRLVAKGARKEDLQAAEARVQAARARLTQAQAVLERLQVRAPIDGQILAVKYRVGEFYNPGAGVPLVVLGDTSRLQARIDIDERDVARVRAGQQAFVIAEAFGSRKFPGEVIQVGFRMGRKNVRSDDPVERLDTKVLEVILSLSDAQGLLPGQRVVGYVEQAHP